MIICGVDPGNAGALAFYNPTTNRIVHILDVPTINVSKKKGKTKTIISWPTLVQQLKSAGYGAGAPIQVYLELVSSSPQMGVTSSFAFGRGFGGLENLFAVFEWPLEYVTPAVWKRHFKLGRDKEASRSKASLIMPADTGLWTPKRGDVTKLQAEGRAEAALIAVYGSIQQRRLSGQSLLTRPRVRL